jgi:hypothetical protein
MSSLHTPTLPTYLSIYLSVCLSAYLAMYQLDRHVFSDYCVQGFVGK